MISIDTLNFKKSKDNQNISADKSFLIDEQSQDWCLYKKMDLNLTENGNICRWETSDYKSNLKNPRNEDQKSKYDSKANQHQFKKSRKKKTHNKIKLNAFLA